MKIFILSYLTPESHSMRISPSSLVEYKMSGIVESFKGFCLYRKYE